jgi:serine/threonine-protein kinase
MSEGDVEDRLGELVAGRYQVLGVLGAGGQSVLYRAKDRADGDEVALKILRRGNTDPNAVERLFREAHILTQLAGTAAVRVLHQLQTDDGLPGLVLELLRGRELAERLDELDAAGERMGIAELTSIFEPIVSTLDSAGDRQIVHRDLKPQNIFLIHPAYGGGVRLLDFGFARSTLARRVTQQGVVAGSPPYLAPEAWKDLADLDHRADVYGLGIVLFRVLSGKLPFTGNLVDILKGATTAPRPKLHALRPDLRPEIDDWVAHALAIDREARFQRTRALWNALRACFPGS